MATDLPLALDPGTLDALPPVLRRGLVAVSFFGILSLVTTCTLFIFLTIRLSRWYWQGRLVHGPNQFLILIYMLLFADIQQAMAFALTSVYLAKDKIEIGTNTCWANGWFISTGDLGSSIFIFSIALHTWFAVVKGRSISNIVFYTWILCAWIFVYTMSLTISLRHNDTYVRAGAWCWVNRAYEKERLFLHYFWIFVFMGGTVVTYVLIFISIRMKARGFGQTHSMQSNDSDPADLRRAMKYMIIYPIAYVICTLPLAGGRMAAMTGIKIGLSYYCLAGAAITSCGWIDVLLYTMTRRVLVFSNEPPPREDFGFDTLGLRHGGHHRFFGTTTTVEGPITHKHPRSRRKDRDIFGRATPRSLKTRHSDEDYFASAPEGVIATKTTVEVSTGPIPQYANSNDPKYASSDFSVLEMEDRPPESMREYNTHRV